jgi:Smg protein
MNDNLLQILLFLFSHHMAKDVLQYKGEELIGELNQAGFAPDEARDAIQWLETLNRREHGGEAINTQTKGSMRMFHGEEIKRISTKARGFITFLDQAGLVDMKTRELIIERAMSLTVNQVTMREMRYVAKLILLRQNPNDKDVRGLCELLTIEKGTIQ